MDKRFRAVMFLLLALSGVSSCSHLTLADSSPPHALSPLDTNGLDERARNGFHIQNVRMALAALAYTQQQNQKATTETLHELLYSELGLLNGFDPNSLPKSEHKGLCKWREHIDAATAQLKALRVDARVELQVNQLERTKRILKDVCE
jgi:hypothetical protein